MKKEIIFGLLLWLCGLSAFAQVPIRKAEYFIDRDPGIGKGKALTFSLDSSSVKENFSISTGNLESGFHTLGVRVKDEEGKWSLTNVSTFFKLGSGNTETPKKLVGYEYFIDHDPGIGNGTYQAVTPALDVSINPNIDLSAYSSGKHLIGFRFLDETNRWSITTTTVIFKMTPTIQNPVANIVRGEYFMGENDPGIGNATAFNFTTPADSVHQELQESIENDLGQGRYFVHFRVQDENGNWSLTKSSYFDICGENLPVANFSYEIDSTSIQIIDESEYAFDFKYDFGVRYSQTAEQEPVYTYAFGGEYTVRQIASTSCDTDTIEQRIEIFAPKFIEGQSIEIEDFQELAVDEEIAYRTIADLDTVFEMYGNSDETLKFYIKQKSRFEYDTVSFESENILKIRPLQGAYDYGYLDLWIADENSTIEVEYRVGANINRIDKAPIEKESNPLTDEEQDEIYQNLIQGVDPMLITEDLNLHFTDPHKLLLSYSVSSSNDLVVPELIIGEQHKNGSYITALEVYISPLFTGEAEITVTVDNGVIPLERPIHFKVEAFNEPPYIVSGKNIQDFGVNDGYSAILVQDLNQHFRDPQGDQMYFKLESEIFGTTLPHEFKIINETQVYISFPFEFNGFGHFYITASDSPNFENGSTVTDFFEVEVRNIKNPPRLTQTHFFMCVGSDFHLDLNDILDVDNGTPDEVTTSVTLESISPNSIDIENFVWDYNETANAKSLSVATELDTYAVLTFSVSATDASDNTSISDLYLTLSGVSVSKNNQNVLTASPADAYQWYKDSTPIQGATSKTYDASEEDGLFFVVAQIGNCSSTSNKIAIGEITSSDDLLDENIMLYPNPTNGLLHISFVKASHKPFLLNVYHLTGRKMVQRAYTSSSNFTIDLSELNTGVYMVELISEGNKVTKKIIIH